MDKIEALKANPSEESILDLSKTKLIIAAGILGLDCNISEPMSVLRNKLRVHFNVNIEEDKQNDSSENEAGREKESKPADEGVIISNEESKENNASIELERVKLEQKKNIIRASQNRIRAKQICAGV